MTTNARPRVQQSRNETNDIVVCTQRNDRRHQGQNEQKINVNLQ